MLLGIVCVVIGWLVVNKIRRVAFHNPDNQGMQRAHGFARSLLNAVFWIYMIIVIPIAIRPFISAYNSAISESSHRDESQSANETRAVGPTTSRSLTDFLLPPLPLSWSDKH